MYLDNSEYIVAQSKKKKEEKLDLSGGAMIECIIRKHRSGDVEDVFCEEVWVASAPGLHGNKN